ncbi:hypothetical protein HD553DRAFT_282789 [Filobasidium floriforme]|uniref:uncharacterized protein n=1 Tax=Filobasidium floriforme TaxID=5210 RepID=UPI001E8DE26B|nr:uncharacterized protein HD553DRAFT_282789 [Filobasidium floriforme]KAH8086904.1 hypothetical protein HD553DRAFT_282789 [Filobasidium floriforme]
MFASRSAALRRAAVALPRTQARTIASTSARRAEVTPLQPLDVVEVSRNPGALPDPQLDGYPELPYVSLQRRVPKGWWDNQERRNFGETLHEQEDSLSMWSPDAHPMPASWALTQMIMAFTTMAGFGYLVYLTKMESPAAKRSYPYNGLEAELGGSADTPKGIAESIEEDA